MRTACRRARPARFKGGRTLDAPVISIDILPTVLDALGVPAPTKNPFDGKSLLPLHAFQSAADFPRGTGARGKRV